MFSVDSLYTLQKCWHLLNWSKSEIEILSSHQTQSSRKWGVISEDGKLILWIKQKHYNIMFTSRPPRTSFWRSILASVIWLVCFTQWRTISSSLACCGAASGEEESRRGSQSASQSVHQPLYPPGRIIHIVRHHPRQAGRRPREAAAYQAVWADNKDFDSVLISKRMLQDHMPDTVLDALEKVSIHNINILLRCRLATT